MSFILKPYYLATAKSLLSLNRKPTNMDKVLAHLLQMRTTKKELTSKEIKTTLLTRMPDMSLELLRKTIHELREDGILIKENNKYSLNIN